MFEIGRRHLGYVALVVGALAMVVFASPAAGAGLSVTTKLTTLDDGVSVAVRAKGPVPSGARALLQRRSGKRWVTATSGRVRRGRVTLRWAQGTPGATYRFRVLLQRRGRTIATTKARTITVPAPPKRPPGSPRPAQPTPTPTPTPAPFTGRQLSLGAGHGCAIAADGVLRCWGANDRGQLGNGTVTSRSYPGPVPGMDQTVAVQAAPTYTCAAKSDRTVWCWGAISAGGLGDYTLKPVRVTKLETGTTLPLTPMNAKTACVITATAQVRCTAPTANLITDPGPHRYDDELSRDTTYGFAGAIDVAVGGVIACAARGAEPVFCWGGYEATGDDLGRPTAIPGTEGIVDVEAGESTACGRTAAGEVRCWGDAADGARGDGIEGALAPPLPSVLGPGLTGASLQASQGCAADTAGAYCWGLTWLGGPDNSLVERTRVATLVPGTAGSVQGVALFHSACARRGDGRVICWGNTPSDTFQPLGAGGAGPIRVVGAVVPDLEGVTDLDGADGVICAVRGAAQDLVCWGDGGLARSPYPAAGASRPAVPGATSGVAGVTVGLTTICVLQTDHAVRCFGSNQVGLDGRAPSYLSGDDSATPGPVTGLEDVAAVDIGPDHGCAATRGGEVRCWGSTRAGQLGRSLGLSPDPANPGNVASATNVAAAVPGISGASAVAAGASHSCAIRSGGRVGCWGANDHGQLGMRPSNGGAAVVDVARIDDAITITAGGDTTCVTRRTHGFTCWGDSGLVPRTPSGARWIAAPLVDLS